VGPVPRRKLIQGLRALGFEGFSGGRHQFMVRGEVVVTVPNPHGRDIGLDLLSRVLRQAGVSRKEWENV
jgi:predicted RNA binding protein YcfA (HicA-like mRNA interferase family)